MNENAVTLTHNQLNAHVKAIHTAVENAKKNIFEICVRLLIIDQSGIAVEDGFKNTADFAAAEFGFARSTTLNYIKIAREYLTTEYIGTGKKAKMDIKSICAYTNDDGETVDYKIGQLNALGRTTAEDFKTMNSDGIISPDMSADAIKKAVKTWYEPEEEAEEEPEEEATTEEAEEPKQDNTEIINALHMICDNAFPCDNVENATYIENIPPQDFTRYIVAAIKALGGAL